MAKDQINKFIWLIDIITRYGRITREDINTNWVINKALSGGVKIPRRTFHSYINGIKDAFGVTISCDRSTYEYYINGSMSDGNLNKWLIDSAAINDTIANSKEIADRISIEDVPSARQNLPSILDAMKASKRIKFKYSPFNINSSYEVVIAPYFVKIFGNRWYVTGHNKDEKKIKTYGLDRITDLIIQSETFEAPGYGAEDFFKDSYGVHTDESGPQKVMLKVDKLMAKYFRALPLHHTQMEEVHDDYSIFTYNMLISSFELRNKILSYGPQVEVMQPPALRARIITDLEDAIKNYK